MAREASRATASTPPPPEDTNAATSASSTEDADARRDAERHGHQLLAHQLRAVATRVARPPADATAGLSAALATPTAVARTNSSTSAVRKPPLPNALQLPLAKKPSAKRRRADVAGVELELDQALVHFANCMRLEFQELNAEFVANGEITFTAWKALWTRRRMSAAFHVEFWESTPSSTHQTILQIALELLVSCIEDHSPFEETRAVASLFGFVFALFSAYSVQLGSPKYKIDVDPRSWTALMVIECACTTGLGSLVFPKASSEVLAMLSALVHKERAFLKCLRGFGYQFRVKSGRAAAAEAREKASDQRRVMSESGLAASDLETLLKEEQVAQLDILSKEYSRSVSMIDATSTSGVNGTGSAAPALKARANRLGAKHAPVSELTQSHEKSRLELLTKLRAYLDAKASAAVSQLLAETVSDLSILELESESKQSDVAADEEDFHFEYDHEELSLPECQQPSGSVRRSRSRATKAASQQQQEQHQTTAAISKTRPTRKRTTRSSVASSENDSLVLLETELSRDVYNVPAPAPPPSMEPLLRKRSRRSSVESTGSAFTFASDAASDGLAELQAELNASLVVDRGAKPGIAQRAVASVEDDSESFSDSTGDSEYEESDGGLAELEAELEAEVGVKKSATQKAKAKATQKPKAKTKTTKLPARKPVAARQPRAVAVVASASAFASRGVEKRQRLLDAVSSVATESDDGLAELQAELERTVDEPKSSPPLADTPTAVATKAAKHTRANLKRKRAPSVVPVGEEGDEESGDAQHVESELSARATSAKSPLKPPRASRAKAQTKAREPSANSIASPRGIAAKRRTVSDAVSIATTLSDDGGDDGLAELQAELERSVAAVDPESVVDAEVAPATTPKRTTRRGSSSAQAPTVQNAREVPSTRQAARRRSVASEKEPELASSTTTTTTRATRARSSAEQTTVKPATQAAARKALPVKPVALGKPPTGKTKKKAVVVVKKAAASKPAAQSPQAKDPDAPAKTTKATAAKQREPHQREGEEPERVSTRLRAKSVPLSAKASTGSIATSDDDDESDDGLGELEAELQASIIANELTKLGNTTAFGVLRDMENLKRDFKCVVHISWQTPLSNGAIVDKYEVRYRIIVVDEDREDATTGGSSGSQGSSSESWRLERATHNRKTREQTILLVGLQFDTLYEFTIRSWNAAGKGEWGRSYKLRTRESPEVSSSAT